MSDEILNPDAIEIEKAETTSETAVETTGVGNLLAEGADVLVRVKNRILQLDELKVRVSDLAEKQRQLDKEITVGRKAMDSEISSVVSKRRSEIEKSFDQNIEATRERLKGVKTKRGKDKGSKVDARVTSETADLNEQVRSLKQDIRGIFSREHIARIFNNGYFFTLYMPDGLGDFLVILLSIVVLLAVPFGIYKLIPIAPETTSNIRTLILVGIYAAVIIIALLLFTLVFKLVREKHLEALRQAKQLREKIKRVRKNIGQMEKNIRKDRDESGYGLEKYDEEIGELNGRINEIIEQKKQALSEFENVTKKDVTEEIKARYTSEIERLTAENEAAYNEQRDAEAEIKDISMEISGKYEPYIGKENMSVPMLDTLIDIINNGDAGNISEAIAYYKKSTIGAL